MPRKKRKRADAMADEDAESQLGHMAKQDSLWMDLDETQRDDVNPLANTAAGAAAGEVANVAAGAVAHVGRLGADIASIRGVDDLGNALDNVLPESLVRKIVRLLVSLYGCIGCFCILALVLYCLDLLAASAIESIEYDGYGEHILRGAIGLISVGALLGMYVTFKFGAMDEQLDRMEQENKEMLNEVKGLRDDGVRMANAVQAFDSQLDEMKDSEKKLKSQIESLDELEDELKGISTENNEEIQKWMTEVKQVFGEFQSLQILLQKANLLNLFYEMECRDDTHDGLNKEEYEAFLFRLDQQTRVKMKKTFGEMDADGDGILNLGEFQDALEKLIKMPDEPMNDTTEKAGKKGKKSKKKDKKEKKKWKKWKKDKKEEK